MSAVKEAETNVTEFNTKMGRTTLADEVVAKIIGIAVREVDGVHDVVGGLGGTLAGIAARVTRVDARGHGVNVEVGEREVAGDLKVCLDYGVNIPQVADAMRRNIAARVQAMTGLTVKEINIQVTDLYFPEEEPPVRRRVA